MWAEAGRDEKTVEAFFDDLGAERAAKIRLVSTDAGSWITNFVDRRAPKPIRCMDPFHLVAWVTDALDEVRREVLNDARRAGQRALAKQLKGARCALWKNPEDLTDRQQAKLADIATNKRLYRAYLLKEQLRQVFQQATPEQAIAPLERWLAWASRSKLPAFLKAAKIARLRGHAQPSAGQQPAQRRLDCRCGATAHPAPMPPPGGRGGLQAPFRIESASRASASRSSWSSRPPVSAIQTPAAGGVAACGSVHDPAASGAGSSEMKRSSTFFVSLETLLS